ncbi:MAG: hypothetical protein MR729_10370 [Dorea sp.]|nr:hypothetical protein [Dorea sp.]
MNQNFRYIENYMRSWIVAADNLYVSSSMKHSVLHKRRMRKVKKSFDIPEEDSQRYRGRIPIISGGSDYHGDQKRGVMNPRDIGECGLTEQEFYQNELLVKLLVYAQ